MALSSSYIGKNCYINMSEDSSIDNCVYGTVIGYYRDSDDEYLKVSIYPYGKVVFIRDESEINVL